MYFVSSCEPLIIFIKHIKCYIGFKTFVNHTPIRYKNKFYTYNDRNPPTKAVWVSPYNCDRYQKFGSKKRELKVKTGESKFTIG